MWKLWQKGHWKASKMKGNALLEFEMAYVREGYDKNGKSGQNGS